MTANPERGEVEIELGGKAYPLRPSFEAIQAIEQGTGQPLVALVRRALQEQALPIDIMAEIVTEGIRAAGRDRNDPLMQAYKTDVMGELIYESGVMNAMPAINEFLVNALNGGAKPASKKSAAKTTTRSRTGG